MELDLILFALFPIPNFYWGKNAIIFGFEMSLSVNTNNNKKNILILGKGETIGVVADLRISKFACCGTQVFVKQC